MHTACGSLTSLSQSHEPMIWTLQGTLHVIYWSSNACQHKCFLQIFEWDHYLSKMAYQSSRTSVFPVLNSWLCHFLPVHNIIINTNNFTMYFSWSFSFAIEKSNNRTHFTLGGIWKRLVHFKLAQHTNTLLRTSAINATKWAGVCQTQPFCHLHSSDSPPLHPFCILNFWITVLYFYGLVSHTSWE